MDWVKDGLSAEQVLKYDEFDIIVLDLGLPKLSGLDLMERLRKQGNEIPILILTARESTDDKIDGLDKGADDYMVKPCDLDELAARIRALHRRKTGSSSPTLQFGKLLLEPSSHDVSYDGKSVPLARREYMLLEKLVESVGKIVTRESLIQTLCAGVVDGFTIKMKVVYSHFPVTVKVEGKNVLIENFQGERAPRICMIRGDTKVDVKGDDVIISGPVLTDVSQTAANVQQKSKVKNKDHRVFLDGIYRYSKSKGIEK